MPRYIKIKFFMASYKKNNYRPNRHKKGDEQVEKNLNEIAQESTTAEVFNTLDDKASRIETWVQNNQKLILSGIFALIVAGLGYMFYQQFVVEPKEKEASNEISFPLQTFENALNENNAQVQDSLFQTSLNGADGRYGFLDIIKNYSGTKAANLALYSAGMAYMNLNQYKEAVEYLDKFKSDDDVLSSLALGNIGDAFAQLKQPKDALEYYQKAFSKTNGYTAPIYLKKAAQVAVELKEYQKALDFYQRIKKEFPKSEEARLADLQISLIETLKNQ